MAYWDESFWRDYLVEKFKIWGAILLASLFALGLLALFDWMGW
jgi:hypothetical protein